MNGEFRRPVFYMDIDDTLLRYVEGENPRPAAGAREFVAWAFEHFEVRWLTRWCRDGRMPEHLVGSFSKMFGIPIHIVREVRGLDWSDTESKVNGIAWVEHIVLERPFLWVEDEHGLGAAEQAFLREAGFEEMWLGCNVTADPEALRIIHERLLHDDGFAVPLLASTVEGED